MTETPSFVHLHNHSDYSLLDGASKIENIVEIAVSMGMPAVALTDHGNLFGVLEFYEKVKKAGIKPLLGCELYVAPRSRHDRKGKGDHHHLVVLAMNQEAVISVIDPMVDVAGMTNLFG